MNITCNCYRSRSTIGGLVGGSSNLWSVSTSNERLFGASRGLGPFRSFHCIVKRNSKTVICLSKYRIKKILANAFRKSWRLAIKSCNSLSLVNLSRAKKVLANGVQSLKFCAPSSNDSNHDLYMNVVNNVSDFNYFPFYIYTHIILKFNLLFFNCLLIVLNEEFYFQDVFILYTV